MTHLLVALSAHGFGHAAQTAPVVNALRQRFPDLRLTLRTRLPRAFLATRFDGEFEWVPQESDFGMVMDTALDVNVAQSAAAYARLHRGWDHQVQQEAKALERLAPDFVLANVPYLTLAGAAMAAIPACAMCSLNWADIHQHFFLGIQGSDSIQTQMLDAYRRAGVFLQLEPGMPMANLPNRHTIGPVARLGANRRAEIDEKLGLPRDTRLVLIAPGGVDLRLPVERWPRASNIHWLVPAVWQVSCPGTSAMEALGVTFTDILRSSDAVIGKPGYGLFTEAACNGIPLLYVRRPDWPEEPYLVSWLRQHGRCLEIDRPALERGEIAASLEKLWHQPPKPPVIPLGIDQAVAMLVEQWPGLSADRPGHGRHSAVSLRDD